MKTVKTKSLELQAEQWNGQDIEGVNVRRPEIVYSRDKSLFYISGTEPRAKEWLSVEKKEDGKYISYPFMFYEIKSHPDHDLATEDHPLVKLYLEMFGPMKLETRAYIDREGPANYDRVPEGHWVVKGVDGILKIYSPAEFAATFE